MHLDLRLDPHEVERYSKGHLSNTASEVYGKLNGWRKEKRIDLKPALVIDGPHYATEATGVEANTMRARRMRVLNPHSTGRLSWIELVALEVREFSGMCPFCKEVDY